MAKPPELHNFTVEGGSHFPYDMLRYNQCWPASQEDAATIERASRPRERGPFSVTLSTHSPNAPTEARWESFGWKVVP
jgi:hypothetical protein